MGMPRGSRWKRLAIFSDAINADAAPRIEEVLWSERIETEWWARTIPATKNGAVRCGPQAMGRDYHPLSETWLMVRRGDWPVAFVVAKQLGVSL